MTRPRSLCERRPCTNVATHLVMREGGARELSCSGCTSATDVLRATLDDHVEKLAVRDLSAAALGTEHELGGKLYRVVEICEEPNTGLVQVEEIGHTFRWNFQIPALWLTRDPNSKTAAEVALDEIAAMCGYAEWSYPGQVVRDVQTALRDVVIDAQEWSEALDAASAATDDLEAKANNAYRERDQCIAALLRAWGALGLTVGLGWHDEKDGAWEDDWRNIVFAELPTGQVSWHVHDSEMPLFAGMEPYVRPWDGHDTLTKYARLAAYRPSDPKLHDDELILAACEKLHCGGGSLIVAIEIMWGHLRRNDELHRALHEAVPEPMLSMERVTMLRTRIALLEQAVLDARDLGDQHLAAHAACERRYTELINQTSGAPQLLASTPTEETP